MVEGMGKYRASSLIKICNSFFKNTDYFKVPDGANAFAAKAKEKFLGKVAYLFVDAARHCDPIQIEFSKIVKAATFDHSLIMSPFMTTVLMGLAGIDHLCSGVSFSIENHPVLLAFLVPAMLVLVIIIYSR